MPLLAKPKIKVCHCKQTDKDPLVQNDLAITPRRMYELTSQGRPISEFTSAYQGEYIDGYRGESLEFEPPHIYTRGADIISCYNEQIESRSKSKTLLDGVGKEE